jgi:hypothetical protein
MTKRTTLVWLVIVCALAIRVVLVIWAGNAPVTPLTGGSDTMAYQTLADNISNHRGMSYAGEPTALRPPLYPLFLAVGKLTVGKDYRIAVRVTQLLAGIVMAIVCGRVSGYLGGSASIAFAAVLATPTLMFFSAELLTETLAAVIVAVFFLLAAKDSNPAWVGVVIGLGMLERFNLAALAVAYLIYELSTKKTSSAVKHVALAGLVAVAIVGPWFARNLIVFNRQVLYSTHTGTNLLQGILTPDGRTQIGDSAKLEAAAGWTISDIETNSPERNTFPSEPQLDRMATSAALAQLRRVNLVALTTRKLGYFWLSLDQLLETKSLSRGMFLLRLPGICFYWLLLGVGIVGWRRLKLSNPDAALLFVIYPVVITAMHLPFVMSTRIRVPLIEPALTILVGLAFSTFPEGHVVREGGK